MQFPPYYSETLYSTNCTLILSNMTPEDACFFNIDVKNSYGYGPGTQVMVGVISAGMETNGFALTLHGLTNSLWRVDCTIDVEQTNWFTITNLTIPGTLSWVKFVDMEATNLHRYYKVIPTVY